MPAAVRSQAFKVVYDRPATKRGECKQVQRPCPFVLCEHHLGVEINGRRGYGFTIDPELGPVVRYPTADSCALDVADRGGATLEEIAATLGITRERVRQVEERALNKLKDAGVDLETPSDPPSYVEPAAVVV